MNISPINNQHKTTNFKALKIDPKLAQKLETKTPEYINKLSNIGESIKDVKRFHVVLDDSFGLTPKILADNPKNYGHRDYYHELKHKIEPYLGKPYYATAGDETVAGINPDIPRIFSEIYNKESRVSKYEEFCKLGELDQAAEYSKLLDKSIAIKEEKALAEKLAEEKRIKEELEKKEAHKKAIAELLDKYGLTTETEKSTEQVKRKWWQRFF